MHISITNLEKKMRAETDPAEAFKIYNHGIVTQMQTYIKSKDWTALGEFVDALDIETQALCKPLLTDNKLKAQTA